MQYMKHMKINIILASMLMLVVFGILYFLPEESVDNKDTTTQNIRDVFKITEADQYVGTENAVELVFDESVTDYTINQGGDYLISGTLHGTLYIDTEDQ